MHRLEFKFSRRPSLGQRLLAVVLGIASLIAVFFLSVFMLALVFGMGLLFSLVILFRRWRQGGAPSSAWRSRGKTHSTDAGAYSRNTDSSTSDTSKTRHGEILEASYTVIRRQRRD